jgi:hypothetical protein
MHGLAPTFLRVPEPNGGTEFRPKADPSLVRRMSGLARDDNVFGSSESAMAEEENSCHLVRTKGNWDVGRFGRLIFFAKTSKAAPPAHEALAPQPHPEAGIYLFYRERQTGNDGLLPCRP